MNGVEILPKSKTKKCGMDEALDDIRCGRITEFDSSEEMFLKLGINRKTANKIILFIC